MSFTHPACSCNGGGRAGCWGCCCALHAQGFLDACPDFTQWIGPHVNTLASHIHTNSKILEIRSLYTKLWKHKICAVHAPCTHCSGNPALYKLKIHTHLLLCPHLHGFVKLYKLYFCKLSNHLKGEQNFRSIQFPQRRSLTDYREEVYFAGKILLWAIPRGCQKEHGTFRRTSQAFHKQEVPLNMQRRRRRGCGPPVGHTRHTTRWCLPALIDLAFDRQGGSLSRPVRRSIMVAVLLFVSSPLSPGPRSARALPPHAPMVSPQGTDRGARRSAGSTSGTIRHPPPAERDIVSRVWALSPPSTTDCAAFGRQVTGACSVV